MRQLGVVLLFAIATGCDGDSTAPIPPASPVQNGLWTVSAIPPAILRLAPAQLSDSGDRVPATRVTTLSAGLGTLIGVAFGPDGTLWMTSADDSHLLGFTPAALATSGSRLATTVIAPAGGSLNGPTGLAFDSEGRLWVANYGSGTLVRFDPGALATGGSPAPAVVVSGVGRPTVLAFDAAGSLWVSDKEASRIVRYDPSQLSASGSPAAALVLTATNGSLMNPSGLAFDLSGNLWVTNIGSGTVVAFSPTQLETSGSPAPQIVLSSNGSSLAVPVGLAFDGDGSLWVAGGEGTLTRFGRASLTASGAPAPLARLGIPGHSILWSVAFWPSPNGLPLN